MKDLTLTIDEVEFLIEFLDTSMFMENEHVEDCLERNIECDDAQERLKLFKSILNKLQ